MEREVALAREVQRSLLPDPLPQIPGFTLAADWRGAREISGDFYDVFPLHDGRWGLVIADMSDKGAPAALYMAMARSLIRTSTERHISPAETLKALNRAIERHSASNMFVTVFYAVLDPASRTLRYASAGHNPPLVRRADGGIEPLRPTGPLIGVLPDLELAEMSLAHASGDLLVAYTDGVTGAQNAQDNEYQLNRWSAALAVVSAGTTIDADRLLAYLLADLNAFLGSAVPVDDLTLLVLICE